MAWKELPKHLESRIVSEISPRQAIKEKLNKYHNNKPVKYGITWDTKENNQSEQVYSRLLRFFWFFTRLYTRRSKNDS